MLEFILMLLLTIFLSLLSMATTILCGLKYCHAGTHRGFADSAEGKALPWNALLKGNWWDFRDIPVMVHSVPGFIARTWWWLVTGIALKKWAAVHRHNHLNAAKKWANGKPSSRLARAKLFPAQRDNIALIEAYSDETPNTWVDVNIYHRLPYLGPLVYFVILFLLLGGWGIVVWIAQAAWMPAWRSESVNGYYLQDFEWNRLYNKLKDRGYFE
jgi:hypothetical protein